MTPIEWWTFWFGLQEAANCSFTKMVFMGGSVEDGMSSPEPTRFHVYKPDDPLPDSVVEMLGWALGNRGR